MRAMLHGLRPPLRLEATQATRGKLRRQRFAPRVAASHQPDLEALYTTQIYSPEPYTSPGVVPRLIPGKGLGLMAERDFGTGDLIFLDRQLGIVYGPAGTAPSNEELTAALCKSSSVYPGLLEWVRVLGSSSRTLQDQAEIEALFHQPVQDQDDEPQRHQQQEASSSGSESSSSTTSTSSVLSTLSISSVLMDEAAAAAAVSCNSYGEVAEDMVVTELKEVEALAFTGLWPKLALVNHSCSPNTSQLMVAGSMQLRAARPILEGEEVTCCYLGQSRFADVARRRASLAADYGFHCQCRRCVIEHQVFPTRRYPETDAEESALARSLLAERSPSSPAASQPGPLQWVLDRLYGSGRFRVGGAAGKNRLLEEINGMLSNSLEADAQDALTALSGGRAKQRKLLEVVESMVQSLEKELQELGLGSKDAALVKASAGGLFRIRHELLQISGLGSPQQELAALGDWLGVLEVAARGSEAHLFVAVQHAAKARALYGQAAEQARRAELACAAAHFARYGKVSPELLKRMMQVRTRVSTGASMASRISMMAWETDRRKERGEDEDAEA